VVSISDGEIFVSTDPPKLQSAVKPMLKPMLGVMLVSCLMTGGFIEKDPVGAPPSAVGIAGGTNETGPLSPAEKSAVSEVVRITCNCAKNPPGSGPAPAGCPSAKPVNAPAGLPGTPKLPGGVNQVNAPMLVDQGFNAVSLATLSATIGQETYNLATGNESLGKKCFGVPLGAGATLATGGTAVGIGGTMLQSAGFAGAGAVTVGVGVGAIKIGVATGGSALAAGAGYTAGRGLDYATGNRISDTLAFVFSVPMDLFNSACAGELDFSVTAGCANNFGRSGDDFSWFD